MTAGYERPRRPWEGRRVVLGVTGGIAAYKAVQIARDLTRLGAEVDAVLSRGAQEFVRPLSFEGVTGRPALTDLFSSEGAARHIRLGREADVVCVAPATADLLARAAAGRADDLLTTTLLATRAPVLLCPAMNDRMWAHPQVRANAAHCVEALGYQLAGPAAGALAVGEAEGPGRLLEPEDVVEHIGRVLTSSDPLRGLTVLVTAGPTREPVDPVRYVGNRASGRMGWAVARAAWRRGADVVLVTGPTSLADPVGIRTVRVETARDMLAAVREQVGGAAVVVHAAAVADYRPERVADAKLKRSEAGDAFALDLVANPDVALQSRELQREGAIVVGFALETGDLMARAAAKLEAKGFDLLVANDATEAGAGFDVETNRVTLLAPGLEPEPLPLLSKDAVAEVLLDRVGARLGAER
jgi:phosphopantothenoylcysteine decarboxylase / phosphopantothenate---cysteine ligase